MTLSSAYKELFIQEEKSGGGCPDTHLNTQSGFTRYHSTEALPTYHLQSTCISYQHALSYSIFYICGIGFYTIDQRRKYGLRTGRSISSTVRSTGLRVSFSSFVI